MLFQTDAVHEVLRQKVRQFAEKEVLPFAFQWDQNNTFPEEAVRHMAQLGLMGLPYPKEYGGAGADVLSYAIAVEELSRADGGTGVILSAHTSLGTYPIAAYGNEAQKQKYLVPLAKGEKLGAFGLTEENAGSDAGGTETTAVREGNGYHLNGKKIFITNGGKADTYVVFAVTQPGIGTKGISAFIVEKGWPGFTFGTHYDKMGIRSSATAELIFKDVFVPAENLLGEEGQGFHIAMATLDGGRIGIASQALGIAQGAYEKALEYAKERIQFGKPIARQQAITFKLADMATKLRAARLLIYSAAELKQAHEPYGMEAAMAKQYASDIALEVTNDALQIYGGSGYLKGMDVERAYRDAKITTIYEGTNEIQRVVIGSYILGKSAKAAAPTAPAAQAGGRKKVMFHAGSAENRVASLVAALHDEGLQRGAAVALDTPVTEAKCLVSAGLGVGRAENMALIEQLACAVGAAVSSSRPAAEMMHWVPMNRFVGLSGQKFAGELYIACGISGASQHLKGIENAKLVVAINSDPNAPIFSHADYGIVGRIEEILPLLAAAFAPGNAAKEADGKTLGPVMVCSLCGAKYAPTEGDPAHGIAPGTPFSALPESWTCPGCGAPKSVFEPQQ
ncbi:MAG: acyl-CoA dehydrogenase family protein [Faecalibacterium sp.]|jgi:alkylation response protein AidB-like acyl-CoA dehydrogenase/rubredoxin|nr:acyl-CoA dehydrogenase family protein [Faecalibacterium sp.]